MYRRVLSLFQNRNLFKRSAPPAKRTPGIDDARRTNAAAFHRSDPLGAREINGANRDKKIEEKKRKIRYGLYGYGPMSFNPLRKEIDVKTSSLTLDISKQLLFSDHRWALSQVTRLHRSAIVPFAHTSNLDLTARRYPGHSFPERSKS